LRSSDGDAPLSGSWGALVLALIGRCVVRPWLVFPLLLTGWRFRRRGWYARFPFLPLPAWTYVQWRMHTAYGHHDAIPPVDDVINYARWSWRLRQ
jgi:hypothetical protein